MKNAIVIGGGIGGLAVATALAQAGVAVTLCEQAEEITEVGAGLQISPNGLVVLKVLGLAARLEQYGAVRGQAVNLVDYTAGRRVARLDLTRMADRRYLFIHRADLVSVLLDGARAANVSIELGRRAVAVRPGDLPQVTFEDGTVARAEIVVAADGLHSVARGVVDAPSDPVFTGQVAWRALVPASDPAPAPEVTVTMGPGRHVVSYPMRGGRVMNLVAVQERDAWAAEGWSNADDPANLRAAFADFGAPVAALLDRVDAVKLWGLFRHPVAANWARGGVVLLGDAAHPTLPFLAQGANMALEDAWAFASVVRRRQPLDAYTKARRKRAERVIAAANGNAWKYHLPHGPLRSAAHMALRVGSIAAPGTMLRQFDWLYGYDITRELPAQ